MIIDTNLSSLKLALETVKITDKIRLSGELCRNSLLKPVPSECSGIF